jgi:hypothetical protein
VLGVGAARLPSGEGLLSPRRPLLQYLINLKKAQKADTMTVVLPEYVPGSWWEHALHGQWAQSLKLSLLFRPGFMLTSVPYHQSIAVCSERPPPRPLVSARQS